MTDTPDLSAFPKYTPNPHLAGIPEYLKDPANYEKVQRFLLDTLASTHSHGDILEWYQCVSCMKRAENHRIAMRELGFRTPRQYYAWKKIMEVMTSHKRDPLTNFKK